MYGVRIERAPSSDLPSSHEARRAAARTAGVRTERASRRRTHRPHVRWPRADVVARRRTTGSPQQHARKSVAPAKPASLRACTAAVAPGAEQC